MKEIPLTQGYVTLVDDSDYELLNKHKWCVHKIGHNRYAVRGIRVEGKPIMEQMHRRIMGSPAGLEVDHRNANGLDNRRENLRICTHSQNLKSLRKIARHSSRFKGVNWNKAMQKWSAGLRVDGDYIFLGFFPVEEDAARIYDKAARSHHGEFALLNFPISNEVEE